MSRRIKLEDIEYAIVPTKEDEISIKAKSSKDEIRLYFNQNQYVTGIDTQDGYCSIELREDVLEEKLESELENEQIQDKSGFKDIISILKECILFLVIISLISTVFIVLIFSNIQNPFLATSIIIYLVCIGEFITELYAENKDTSEAVKSKHSAEHIICNFIEKNKRLPREWNEIQKSARFSNTCGSIRIMKDLAEKSVHCILYGILFSCIGIIAGFFIQSEKILLILYGINIFLLNIVVSYLVKKYKIFDDLRKKLQHLYGHFLQYGNTTKNVKEKDIILAYSVASVWLQIVYPKYYDKDKDSKFTRNE